MITNYLPHRTQNNRNLKLRIKCVHRYSLEHRGSQRKYLNLNRHLESSITGRGYKQQAMFLKRNHDEMSTKTSEAQESTW